jgi:hypothetical protein
LPVVERPSHARELDALRTALGPAAFDEAWRTGQVQPLDQVISDALAAAAT